METNQTNAEPIVMRPISHYPIPAYVLNLLESLRCGCFLLDLRGRVLSLNMLALGCLGDGITLGGNHLSAMDRATDQRLQHLVGTTLSSDGVKALPPVAVQRATRQPLMIRPIRLEQQIPQSAQSPALLLLVVDPELWPEPRHEMLAQAFGLTASEANVAIGIASGRTLSQIAVDRRVKIGTVRAHLKTVFAKTHTRGQADLTRILTRLALLTPQPESKAKHTRSA